MAQLIDKSALVAEIDKLKGKVNDISSFSNGWQQALRLAEIEINTLEVKEVEEPVSEDLEEAAWLYYDRNKPLMPPELDLHKELIDFFKAGAEWKKKKDLKEE